MDKSVSQATETEEEILSEKDQLQVIAKTWKFKIFFLIELIELNFIIAYWVVK